MGNDFAKPTAKNVLKPLLFQEYVHASLVDVKEASAYLGGRRAGLTPKEFDDVFSVLFKDCDQHFVMFEKNSILSQLPASQQDEDGQENGTVNPLVVCTIVALLSKGSVDSKFIYLHDLFFGNHSDMEVSLTMEKSILLQVLKSIIKLPLLLCFAGKY